MPVYMCKCLYMRMHMHLPACTAHVYMGASLDTCAHACRPGHRRPSLAFMQVCVAWKSLYHMMYAYIHTHTHKHTHKHTFIHTYM